MQKCENIKVLKRRQPGFFVTERTEEEELDGVDCSQIRVDCIWWKSSISGESVSVGLSNNTGSLQPPLSPPALLLSPTHTSHCNRIFGSLTFERFHLFTSFSGSVIFPSFIWGIIFKSLSLPSRYQNGWIFETGGSICFKNLYCKISFILR